MTLARVCNDIEALHCARVSVYEAGCAATG
jgi:hypothetical protein